MPTLEELVDENDRLSLQVKRLIRAESRLYAFQEELEKQRSLFKKLSVAGARLNDQLSRDNVLRVTLECIVVDLGFERAIALVRSDHGYQLSCHEGYYDPDSATALSAQSLTIGSATAATLIAAKEPLLYPSPETSQPLLLAELSALSAQTQLDRFFLCPVADSMHAQSAESAAAVILLVGGGKSRARFHAPVTRDSPVLPLLSILLLQAVTAMCNANLYAELLSEKDSLERKVVARTAELVQTNQALTVALEKARESERVKMEFLASVSHELRTPLNSIINIPDGLLEEFPIVAAAVCPSCDATFALDQEEALLPITSCPSCHSKATLHRQDLVVYEGNPQQTKEYLHTVVQCGKHLLHVVNDILDASRLEAGRVELQESVVTLSEVMQAVQQAVGSLALARDLQLQLPSLNPAMTMWGDPLRLTQILINLIGNAIKFSHPGGRVMVRVLTTPKGVRWEVQDEGIGIAKEDQERIFESFRQVEGGDTRRYGGSGLGLAITRQLVELHHGRVWVESIIGSGSTFVVELPQRLPPEPQP